MSIDRNERLIGESSELLEVQEHVSQIAPLDKPVLIIGERGTGKELIASRVHYLSERWGQPFLKLNCAAISESLIDSELFGHESGSFSGASRQHKGLFERADGGTLFLDELAATSVQVQEKILRVIEYGEFTRLGGDKVVQTDVRLVAATNGDLPGLVAKKEFRADLLDRLAFDVITLPPLRARLDDIPILAEFFALSMIKELKREYFPGFSKRAMQSLLRYQWPGNIRELKNVVERAVYRSREPDDAIDSIIFDPFESPYRIAADGDSLSAAANTTVSAAKDSIAKDSAGANSHPPPSLDLWHDYNTSDLDVKTYVENIEIALLKQALSVCQHNQKNTAQRLGLSYHQLRACLRKYKIS
ncbi:MAG: psp operon transcriptional activator [Flavobacteriales bacterium]|jgi:psp operon transcriptional activator